MLPNSLRWRLPLSYAAIALLVALSLGAVLLMTVRGYYGQQELEYLNGNVRAIAQLILATNTAKGEDWLEVVRESQLQQLAFLSQSRVQVMDAGGQVIADSGPAKPRTISLARFMIYAPKAPKPPVALGSGVTMTIGPEDIPLQMDPMGTLPTLI